MKRSDLVLIDTNAIIEAVRTGCWSAISGQLRVETVEACRQEALTSPPTPGPGYVPVSEKDLRRLASVHAVGSVMRAAFKLAYEDADGLDAGEHDLLAHAHSLSDEAWVVCFPDKASIRWRDFDLSSATEPSVFAYIRALVQTETFGERFVTKVLGKELGLR